MNNDKKKLMILGVLALLMVAVGAFTFMGGGAPASPEVLTTKAADAYGDGTDPQATGEETAVGENDPTDGISEEDRPESGVLALAPFEPRDPFETPSSVPKVGAVTPPPVQQPTAQMAPIQGNPRPNNPNNAPLNPGDFGGSIGGGNSNLPPIVVAPTFIVKGIILGAKPMAVFEDGQGNQRLVALGGSVDGDTKVVAIEQGKVTVVHKGKRYSLALQEVARND